MNVARHILAILSVSLILAACAPAQGSLPAAGQADLAQPTQEITPVWLTVPMVDAKTGESFTVNDLAGKVVLVEGMATWCPSCWSQGRELKKLYEMLGTGSDLVIISLDLDTNEDAQALIDYSNVDNFEWQFVTSTLPMYHDLGNRYGALYLDPTLGPFLLVDRKGQVTNIELGLKTADELKTLLDPMLNEE